MIETIKRVLIAPAEVVESFGKWLATPALGTAVRYPGPFAVFYCLPLIAIAVYVGAQYGDWSVVGALRFYAAYWATGTLIQLAARPAHVWLSRH